MADLPSINPSWPRGVLQSVLLKRFHDLKGNKLDIFRWGSGWISWLKLNLPVDDGARAAWTGSEFECVYKSAKSRIVHILIAIRAGGYVVHCHTLSDFHSSGAGHPCKRHIIKVNLEGFVRTLIYSQVDTIYIYIFVALVLRIPFGAAAKTCIISMDLDLVSIVLNSEHLNKS